MLFKGIPVIDFLTPYNNISSYQKHPLRLSDILHTHLTSFKGIPIIDFLTPYTHHRSFKGIPIINFLTPYTHHRSFKGIPIINFLTPYTLLRSFKTVSPLNRAKSGKIAHFQTFEVCIFVPAIFWFLVVCMVKMWSDRKHFLVTFGSFENIRS